MVTATDKLINVENYAMDEIWQKFIVPGTKDTYTHEELFATAVPVITIFEGVPVDKAFAYLSDIQTLSDWTISLRELQPFRGDIYVAREDASPTGKVYIRVLANEQAHTIEWQCNHSDPDDLWMVYKCMVVDANQVLGRPGSAFIWVVFVHGKVQEDPALAAGYKMMYTAHSIEAGNLKKVLESRFAGR
ncbi:MAG TPA: hypothetical protein VNT26_08000 [Candidatus Sulfotelmatobacter sp.]|nr:hypothetical protein [Candidatus Sulfotelmatobacter sp.]